VILLKGELSIFVSKPSMLLNEISIIMKFSLVKLWSWVVLIKCSCLENGDMATCISQGILRSGCCVCVHTLTLVVFLF
jgi:hypothetical protein